jgi:hypothetical protein
MGYRLTLTREERKAIDWVGERYSGAPKLKEIVCKCIDDDEDDVWEGPDVITVVIPEHHAWELEEAVEEDMEGNHEPWPCFSADLYIKLEEFRSRIV